MILKDNGKSRQGWTGDQRERKGLMNRMEQFGTFIIWCTILWIFFVIIFMFLCFRTGSDSDCLK